MNLSRELVATLLLLIVTACSSSSSGPDGSADVGGGSDGSTNDLREDGGGSDVGLNADGAGGTGGHAANPIAVLAAKVPATVDTSVWLQQGESLQGTTLLLLATSMPEQCAAPTFAFGRTNHRLLIVGLPRSAQSPGVYQFSSNDIIGWESSWLGDGAGSGGGGSRPMSTGQIELTAIDTMSVDAVITDVGAEDGTYHFEICP